MTKVFIGGSRRTTRLPAGVRKRLDRIIEKGFAVLIGDANGADRAVQQYLKSKNYENVEVFCSNGVCRKNVGNWPTRIVKAPRGARGFDFYSAKDKQMAEESSIGFMLWDGESRGTQANIIRLLEAGKKVVLYLSPAKQFLTLRFKCDWETLIMRSDGFMTGKRRKDSHVVESRLGDPQRAGLF